MLNAALDYGAKKKKSRRGGGGLIIGGICCLLMVALIIFGIYKLVNRNKQLPPNQPPPYGQ
jgi:hypothetical protein